jgi:hypothetical protein
MCKSLALIALTLVGIVITPRGASALAITTGLAESLCKGSWVHNMETGVRICAYCQKTGAGNPRCDYFVCDSTNCEWIIVEKRKPGGKWSRPTPVIPRGSR